MNDDNVMSGQLEMFMKEMEQEAVTDKESDFIDINTETGEVIDKSMEQSTDEPKAPEENFVRYKRVEDPYDGSISYVNAEGEDFNTALKRVLNGVRQKKNGASSVEDLVTGIKENFGLDYEVKDPSKGLTVDVLTRLNTGDDLTDEDIDAIAEEIMANVKVPEVIKRESELDDALGLTVEQFKDLYKYVSGARSKPEFLDKYLADIEGRSKDLIHVMNLYMLSKIPQLVALQTSIQQRLCSPENLGTMDVKLLSATSASLAKEIDSILSNSVKFLEALNTLARPDSKYRNLLDKLLGMPNDRLQQVEHLIDNWE